MVRTVATPRELLATALKQSRLNADYTSHSSLSKKMHVSRPVISKAENPSQAVPSDALLVSWARATGADLGTLRDLATRCKSGTPDWFMPNTGVWYDLDIAARDNMVTVCLPTLRDVTSTAPDLVDSAMQVFERILGYAMPCGDSLDFLRTQEDQWKARI